MIVQTLINVLAVRGLFASSMHAHTCQWSSFTDTVSLDLFAVLFVDALKLLLSINRCVYSWRVELVGIRNAMETRISVRERV